MPMSIHALLAAAAHLKLPGVLTDIPLGARDVILEDTVASLRTETPVIVSELQNLVRALDIYRLKGGSEEIQHPRTSR